MKRWLVLMHHGSLAAALALFGLAPSACGDDDSVASATSTASGSGSSSSSGSSGEGGSGGMGANGIGGMGGSGGMAGGMAGAGGMGGGMAAVPKPDFKLIDTNPNSPTANAEVSPSQFLGKISAWYFGHGT